MILSLVEALERFEVGGKIAVFRLQQNIFLFWKNYFVWKIIVILLDVFGFGHKIGPYQYAKSPSY